MGNEVGQDKVLFGVASRPENLMAIVQEQGFIGVNFTVLDM